MMLPRADALQPNRTPSGVRSQSRSARYLAIRVVCRLDAYIRDCAAVVNDNGTCMGEREHDGYLHPQIPLPDPPDFATDIDWKSIDANLAYRLLSLSNDIGVANDLIQGASNNASPPDFEELFEEREDQYSKLGLKAHTLAQELRSRYQIPTREFGVLDWNPV